MDTFQELKIADSVFSIDTDGILHLPEGYTVKSISIENTDYAHQRLQSKRHYTFLPAFRDAFRKIESKSDWHSYKISLHYATETNSSDFLTLSYIRKQKGKVSYTILGKDYNELPSSWFPKKRKQSLEIDKVKKELSDRFNIKDFLLSSAFNKATQLTFLLRIKDYYETLAKEVELFHFEPAVIATSKMKKWGGKFDKNEIIRIIPDKESAFYHEYYHHMDLKSSIYRTFRIENIDDVPTFIQETKAGILYEVWWKKLLASDTMQSFIASNDYLLDERGHVLPKFKNTKWGQHYEYWTSYDEMAARFFSDYMFYTYNKHLPDRSKISEQYGLRTDFTIEEIKLYEPDMKAFLKETAKLSRDKKDTRKLKPLYSTRN